MLDANRDNDTVSLNKKGESKMKKYKVIGKSYNKNYGYLASHQEDIFEANNKKEAIELARTAFITSNKFIVEEVSK